MVGWNALVYFDLQGYNNIPLPNILAVWSQSPFMNLRSSLALQHSICLFVRGSAGLVSVLKEALGDYVLQSHEGKFSEPLLKREMRRQWRKTERLLNRIYTTVGMIHAAIPQGRARERQRKREVMELHFPFCLEGRHNSRLTTPEGTFVWVRYKFNLLLLRTCHI